VEELHDIHFLVIARVSKATILRSTSTRVFISSYLAALLPLFIGVAITTPSTLPIALALIAASILGIIRGVRSGYVAIYNDRIIVRTLLATREYPFRNIATADVETYRQFTLRVRPVLHFVDGKSYPVSDFFMQKRLYDRDVMNNKVTNFLNAMRKALITFRSVQ